MAHAYVANTTQTGQFDLSYSVTLGGKGFIPYTGVEGNPYLVNGICDDGSMARCEVKTNQASIDAFDCTSTLKAGLQQKRMCQLRHILFVIHHGRTVFRTCRSVRRRCTP